MVREEEIRQEMSKIAGTHPDWTKNDCMRMGFYEGAKWADKTMLVNACEWLKGQLIDNQDNCGYAVVSTFDSTTVEEFICDFKKAMEL